MTLAERCASCFHPEVWARGLILGQQGQVTLHPTDEARVRATIQPHAGPPVQVVLEFDLRNADIEVVAALA